MRITNLHLILSLLILWGLVLLGRQLDTPLTRGWRSLWSNIHSVTARKPQAVPADQRPTVPGETADPTARQAALNAVSRAKTEVETAAAQGYDVSDARTSLAQAVDVADRAAGPQDIEKARALTDEALRQAWRYPPAAPAEVPEAYVVQRGDNLWTISKKLFGRGSLWVKVWRANEGAVPDFDAIETGQSLHIPESLRR